MCFRNLLVIVLIANLSLSQSAVLLGQKNFKYTTETAPVAQQLELDLPSLALGFLNVANTSCIPGSVSNARNAGMTSSYCNMPLKRAEILAEASTSTNQPSETSITPNDIRPTPAPTGISSTATTVHIKDENDFALLLPNTRGGMSSCHAFDIGHCTNVGVFRGTKNSYPTQRVTA